MRNKTNIIQDIKRISELYSYYLKSPTRNYFISWLINKNFILSEREIKIARLFKNKKIH